jgi:uncharacterized paraquat-inducible protein A
MLTTVAIFRDPWEAQLFQLRLEAEGVAAFVVHDHHIGMNWPWSRALGGVKVQVLDDEVQDAQSVAQRCRAGEFRADLLEMFGDLDEPTCPRCGSHDFSRRGTGAQIAFSFTAFLLTGAVVPPLNWLRRCRFCGMRWAD